MTDSVIQKNWQDLIKPTKLQIKQSEAMPSLATLVAEPLEFVPAVAEELVLRFFGFGGVGVGHGDSDRSSWKAFAPQSTPGGGGGRHPRKYGREAPREIQGEAPREIRGGRLPGKKGGGGQTGKKGGEAPTDKRREDSTRKKRRTGEERRKR